MKKGYFQGDRGPRGVKRTTLHVKLTDTERATLVKLTHKLKMSATDVIRSLIDRAA